MSPGTMTTAANRPAVAGRLSTLDRWLPVWAAARLAEDIEQEREFLLERAR